MEWVGWYFEFRGLKVLQEAIQNSRTPFSFGNVDFDFATESLTLDLKGHVAKEGADPVPCNDSEAVRECFAKEGAWAVIVACGTAEYDENGSFKQWHDQLKGEPSAYVRAGQVSGRAHRRRKAKFDLERLIAVCFFNIGDLERGLQDGWVKPFQKGMVNSDGTPRREKYQILLGKVPTENLIELGAFQENPSE